MGTPVTVEHCLKTKTKNRSRSMNNTSGTVSVRSSDPDLFKLPGEVWLGRQGTWITSVDMPTSQPPRHGMYLARLDKAEEGRGCFGDTERRELLNGGKKVTVTAIGHPTCAASKTSVDGKAGRWEDGRQGQVHLQCRTVCVAILCFHGYLE